VSTLILGLLIFLGVHSSRFFADGWRSRTITRVGAGPWKAGYALLSLLGFMLLVWGYGLARQQPLLLWTPPTGMRHVAALLTLIAFVLLVAAYVPRNSIKARVYHPMVGATKVWAFAHLLANGTLADVVLFGSFLGWSVLAYLALRRRDRAAGTVYATGAFGPTVLTVVLGSAAWAVFAFVLHRLLIGVSPMV
jgi:uncharacterized membrane protein